MARPAKIDKALARARKRPPADPLDAPAIVAITKEFLALKVDIYRTLVDKAIELGQILIRAKPLMKGHYERWEHDHLGIDPNTGDNYVALAKLAEKSPRIIHRWKELGPSKLYRLAHLKPSARQTVLQTPGVSGMIDARFADLTGRYVVRRRKVTGNMRAHGVRMRVQAYTRKLTATKLTAVADASIRSGLRADLQELIRAARALAATLA